MQYDTKGRKLTGEKVGIACFSLFEEASFQLNTPTCPLWGTLKIPIPVVCRTPQINSHHISAVLPLTSAPVQEGSPVPAQAMDTGLKSQFILSDS